VATRYLVAGSTGTGRVLRRGRLRSVGRGEAQIAARGVDVGGVGRVE